MDYFNILRKKNKHLLVDLLTPPLLFIFDSLFIMSIKYIIHGMKKTY